MAFHTMFNTILFDFDGTLANTNGLVIESWQHVYRVLTGSEAEEEALKATFGEPLAVSMAKYFPDTPVESAIAIYRGHQEDIYEKMIEPFPGMVELIKELKARGLKTAVTTSRMRNTTMIGLNKFGVAEYLDEIITCDDCGKHKPDPEPVLITLDRLGAKAEEALMVGDSMFDIKCAHNAGVKAVLVGWAEAVTKADLDGPDAPEYFIEKAEDLLKLV